MSLCTNPSYSVNLCCYLKSQYLNAELCSVSFFALQEDQDILILFCSRHGMCVYAWVCERV